MLTDAKDVSGIAKVADYAVQEMQKAAHLDAAGCAASLFPVIAITPLITAPRLMTS